MEVTLKHKQDLVQTEISLARRRWRAGAEKLAELRRLLRLYNLSVALGDVLFFENGWYVTHAGLLRLAHRSHCLGIKTILQKQYSDPTAGRWVFKAIVYCSRSKGFVGYGDADPANVSSLVHGAEMRVAETRAVNRALRKAYGIGLCSVEELGWAPRSSASGPSDQRKVPASGNNSHGNGQPRLRDRLCLLIRQYNLDAGLVKAYAADYCGTATLRDASRDQIETFINSLAESAAKDREALVCQLNSYVKQQEASS
jgi:hypothetical protein